MHTSIASQSNAAKAVSSRFPQRAGPKRGPATYSKDFYGVESYAFIFRALLLSTSALLLFLLVWEAGVRSMAVKLRLILTRNMPNFWCNCTWRIGNAGPMAVGKELWGHITNPFL